MMPGKKWIGACLIALCGASQSAFADWKGKGELGASFASGNSENESANAARGQEYARQMDTYPGFRR
jgi:putative salt-induced outer membrane protein YdiY